ncbi:MAG: hypothetical protein BWX66_01606 [Deltaproteobacteria bacterium ADurb.Bin058]|nr:MAG: hypothetical protein BWX66_01606 [Deltaproteobacteria bacterium ADurb.Bin058]
MLLLDGLATIIGILDKTATDCNSLDYTSGHGLVLFIIIKLEFQRRTARVQRQNNHS